MNGVGDGVGEGDGEGDGDGEGVGWVSEVWEETGAGSKINRRQKPANNRQNAGMETRERNKTAGESPPSQPRACRLELLILD